MRKLAIVSTHPIQYNAPFFELLSKRGIVDVMVFYTWGESVLKNKYDPGFGKIIEWDIPLLKGYKYKFLENVALDKGSHHFKGINNPSLIKEIEAYNPYAILFYGWSFKSHLQAMRYFKGKIPVLFRGDSHLLDQSGFLSKIKRKIFLSLVYKNIDVAFYVGKSNYNYFLNALVPASKLIFAPHAIDNKRFECSEPACKIESFNLRRKLGIGDLALVFLFAGKLEPKKNPQILIEVFNSIKEVDTFLILAGNGELEIELKMQARDNSNIKFIDFQNQSSMPALYETADVFVLPSIGPGETWGLSVNEAMANGKAVLVSDKCGCAENLVDVANNGYIFKSGNFEDLKEKVLLIKKLNLSNARDRSKAIIKDYSLEHLAETVEKTINGFKVKQGDIK